MSSNPLMAFLSNAWRKAQLFAEVHNLVAPDKKVVEEMESQGWKIEEDYALPPVLHPGAVIVLHRIFTPEGDRVLPGTPERKRYEEARADAARKVFGPPSPGPA